MIELSKQTVERINQLFSSEIRKEVESLLMNKCAENIPFCQDSDQYKMERIRFAVLKLGEGNLDKLKDAIGLAQIDWRDLLLIAGFGDDLEAHKKWNP